VARIVWSATARDDLRDITLHIAADSRTYARSFALRLRGSVERLARFPKSGRQVPEDTSRRYREIIVGNYRVIYRSTEDEVVVVTVLHGARDLRTLLDRGLEHP